MATQPPRLELRGISRRFGTVQANQDVSLSVAPGEIHALLGENGAGKSTLVKMIYGVLRPDQGDILWHGTALSGHTPQAARRLGIGMVFQHFSLFEAMTVLENVALGLDAPGPMQALAERVASLSAAYGLSLDPARRVASLGVGERQRIEIVRCLLQAPKLLVMDEPTSVLTPQEADRLFETLRALAAQGCSILYISHKLGEIRSLCGAATVLRAGRVVARCDPRAESTASLSRMMMGADLQPAVAAGRSARAPRRLVLDSLTQLPATAGGVALHDVSLEVRGGEIAGIAGIAGNGQAELFAAISGECRAAKDADVLIDEASFGHAHPAARRRRGLCCLPEERNGHGAIPGFSLAENALLTAHARLAPRGVVRKRSTGDFAARIIAQFGVRCTGPDDLAASLSGGNLQKFVLGREILQEPGVLVVAQPSWGVDAGAAAMIHQALIGLAEAGAAILILSQDLDELFALCHRLTVLQAGRLTPFRPTRDWTPTEIGLRMANLTAAAA